MSLEEPSAARKVAWPALAAGLFFAVLAVVVAVTFEDYGISWDEEVQNIYGDKLLAFYASGFRDRAAMSYMNLFFYGGFFDLVAALLKKISPFGAYETRHLWGGVFFLFGLLGAWRLTRLLAGPRAALIAVAMLALHPVLYGHSFINPKDAPLAWLTLWVLYYACRAIAEERPRPTTVIGFGLAAGVALGTRILAVPLLGYVLGGLVLGGLMQWWRPTQSVPMKHAALGLAAGLPLAYAVMALLWPWAVQSPLNPITALHEFTNFPWRGMILWNGEMVSANALPRNYLNLLLVLQLPEHTLLGLIFGLMAGVTVLWRRWLGLFANSRMIQYAIVIAAAVVPIVGFMILTPTVYNGLRHFLFVVPVLGVLAAIGWDRALVSARTFAGVGGRGVQAALAAVLTALLAWQVLVMVDLHPYQYVAYNRLAGGLTGASGRFELDYWDTSLAEASHRLAAKWPKTAPETPPVVFVCGNRLSAQAFLPKYVRMTYKIEEADYFLSIVPSPCKGQVDVTKNRIVEVRRDGVTLGYVIDLKAGRAQARN